MIRSLLILSSFALFTHSAFTQSSGKPPVDTRVKAALDKIGYKYELDVNNDFKLTPIQTEQVNTPEGKSAWRTQLVYVNSSTEKYGSLQVREVLAPAFLSDSALSADLANRLLRENNKVKLGAWRVVVINSGPNAGKYLAMYGAQVDANCDAETLRLAIKSVILVADRMEKDVTRGDDY